VFYSYIIYIHTMYLHIHNMIPTLVFPFATIYERRQYRTLVARTTWRIFIAVSLVRTCGNSTFGLAFGRTDISDVNIISYFFFVCFIFSAGNKKREITFTAVYLWYERIIYFILLLLLLLPIYYTMKYYKVQFTHIIIW